MSRETIERVIETVYEARRNGDLDGMLAHFTDGASFSIAGSTDTSAVPVSCCGGQAIRETLRQLSDGFAFDSMERVDTMIDGDRAALHWRVHVRGIASGREAVMEVLDVVRFDGDKIASFTQFADTAHAAHLLGS